jgi:hypothetical protein
VLEKMADSVIEIDIHVDEGKLKVFLCSWPLSSRFL